MQYGISIDLVLFTYNRLSLNKDMMGSQCILCHISKHNRRHEVRTILAKYNLLFLHNYTSNKNRNLRTTKGKIFSVMCIVTLFQYSNVMMHTSLFLYTHKLTRWALHLLRARLKELS